MKRYVICTNGIRVGFMDVDYVCAPHIVGATISYFEVDPAFRGRGLGLFIFNTGLGLLEAGTYPVQLFVDDDNPAAQRIYERAGFKVVGEVQNLRQIRMEQRYD